MEVTVSGVTGARRLQLVGLLTRLRGCYSGALVVGRTAVVVVSDQWDDVDFSAPKLRVAAANGIPVVSSAWLEDSAAHGFLLGMDKYVMPAEPRGRRSSASSSTSPAGAPAPAPAAPEAPEGHTGAAAGAPVAGVAGEVAGAVARAAGGVEAQAAAHAATPPPPERLRAAACAPHQGLGPMAAPFLEQADFPAASPLPSPPGRMWVGQQEWAAQGPARDELPPGGTPPSPAASAQVPPAVLSPAGVSGMQLVETLAIGLPGEEVQPSSSSSSALVQQSGGPQKQTGTGREAPPLPHPPDRQPAVLQHLPGGEPGSSHSAAAPAAAFVPLQMPQLPSPQLHTTPASSSAGGETAAVAGPAAAALPCSSGAGCRTDSDTKVARFLSQCPQVTLARGSRMPRQRLPASSDSSSSPADSPANSPRWCRADRRRDLCRSGGLGRWALHSSLLRDSEHPDAATPASGSPGSPAGRALQESAGPAAASSVTHITALHSTCDRSSAGTTEPQDSTADTGTETDASLEPPQAAMLPHWCTQSTMRMQTAGRLPATTLIRLGPPLRHAPGRSTLEGIAEWHGAGGGTEQLGKVAAFHASARALTEDGQELEFVAGDAIHGAVILYDIREDGCRVHALALVQSIYKLGDEAWMEHRYLFTAGDLRERPNWAAALRGHTIKAGEVLLSVGCYHSPMHLICGDFWLTFPGRALRLGQGHGTHAAAPGRQQQLLQRQSRQPAPLALAGAAVGNDGSMQLNYACRKGFDAAAGAMVPLRRALEGFSLAA